MRVMRAIRKRLTILLIVMVAIVAYVSLTNPDQIVEPSFKYAFTSTASSSAVPAAKTPVTVDSQTTPVNSTPLPHSRAVSAGQGSEQTTNTQPSPSETPSTSISPSSETDPTANYYDQWGNEFNYQGALVQAASCSDSQSTPSGANPYCEAQ
jgi:hypothetical protein